MTEPSQSGSERRWIVGVDDPGTFVVTSDETTVEFLFEAGKDVSGPWVPEADYLGAVEALRKINAVLEQDQARPGMLARIEEIVDDALGLYAGGRDA